MIHKTLSISRCTYDVFLSFRGEDTRKNFTDHLYTALVQVGIHTFRDNETIERGKNITDEIEKAILYGSKIFLIVFSKNYASSTWCLDELVKILEHRKSSQHTILPIFYDVDPTEVKNQTGIYAEAFSRHEESFKSEKDTVQKWRDALKQVADFGGMVLQDRHESQFIQDIVKQVQNKLHRTTLSVPSYLVGIDYLVKCINRWLEEDESNKVGITTICGIGGIGKTTIAKVVYNQNIQKFEGYTFLANVRETSEECNGLVCLQRQLISDIIKGKAQKIYNVDDGINKIKAVLSCRRVLLVLDDVDDLEKINKIVGTHIPFHPGSKIIITSRNRNLLTTPFISQLFDLESLSSYGVSCKEFEVRELGFNESLQLFNWYAFSHNFITESFKEYATSIVKYCGGLPLALHVLGSSLFRKSLNVWKSAMKKLEAIPDSKIHKILRVSYDSLQDDHDKNLFLDIACFFIGKDKDYTITILDGCNFYTTIGLENLIGRSLLTVNEKNKLIMHQLVQDMGREIVCQESSDLGKRSRLWYKDAFDVIREKTGSRTIKCLSVDLQGLLEHKSRQTNVELHFAKHSKSRFVKSNEADVEIEAFTKMQRLKLLQLDYVKPNGEFKKFPKGLIWLRWHGFPLQYLPIDLDIKRLIVLDMRHSSLKRILYDTECLANLKILNLSHSHDLIKTPNFSRLSSLEKLMLKDCKKLNKVDQSIGELKKLTFLNLKDCINLMKLPRTIGLLASLEVLILSGCSRLEDFPQEVHNMKSLMLLDLDKTTIHQSKSSVSWLSLKRRKESDFFWEFLPCTLVKLSLESCRLTDGAMPTDLCNLASLKYLNLSRNPLHNLPESIKSLTKLDELLLTSCTKLQVIPKLSILPNSNEFFKSLSSKIDALSTIPLLFSSKSCVIFGCEKLIEVQDVFKLEPIENFEGEEIKSLFNIDSIDSNKVQLYNYLTDTKLVVTPQVLHECGITSTFIQGSEIPIWFKHRTKGPHMSFYLPTSSHPSERISWFNMCIVFSLVSDQIFESLPNLFIFNETKDILRSYFSSFIGISKTNNNTMLWLIHWPTSEFQLEGGDFLSIMIPPFNLNVREFGVTYGSEDNAKYEFNFPHCCPGNENIERNMELELTEDLLSFDTFENVKMQIYKCSEETKMVASPQVSYDRGIIKVFDAFIDVPFDFYHLSTGSPKISITVPPNSSQKISWLKSMIIFSVNNDNSYEFLPQIEIVNETRGTKWIYSKHFIGISEAKNTVYWLNIWKFMGNELNAGDCISLRVLSDLCMVGCSIELEYDNDKCYPISQLLWTKKYSSLFTGAFAHLLFKTRRTLYRMQSLFQE